MALWQNAAKIASNNTKKNQTIFQPSNAGSTMNSAPIAKATMMASKFPTTNITKTTTAQPTGMNQTIGNLSTAVNTPFQYNPESDKAYQAYVRQAQQNLATNQANTNARLRATGQGKSSYSETVANQLGNAAAADMQNAMITQYLPQAYQQYQDRIGNLSNLYQTQYQDEVTKPLAFADETGTLLTNDMKNLYDVVLKAKQNYANAKTSAERDAARQAANMARQQIAALGGNSDLVGANVTADQAAANRGQFGVRTIAGQDQDLRTKQANLDAARLISQDTGKLITPQSDWSGLYRQAENPNTPYTQAGQINNQNITMNDQTINNNPINNLWTVADKTGIIPDALADMYGIPRGTPTQAAKQLADQFGLQQDQNDLAWIEADNKAADAASKASEEDYNGMSANQVFDAISTQYTDQYIDPQTGEVKKRLTTDPTKRYNMFLSAIDAGLPDAQTDQILSLLGLSKDEIKKFTEQATKTGK